MSQHDLSLERTQEAVDELMRKVDVLREERPEVYADVVHLGVAASVHDPADEPSPEANAKLGQEYDSA